MAVFQKTSFAALKRLDWRVVAILCVLMVISLMVISAMTMEGSDHQEAPIFTKMVLSQLQWFGLGWGIYLACALFDYRRLREWTWILYLLMIVALVGLFFTSSVQSVHRWYRLPLIGVGVQPSEYAKLIMVIALSWFLEFKGRSIQSWRATAQGLFILLIPFLLILKQPDLGSALVFFPTALVMFYFGGVRKSVLWTMAMLCVAAVFISSLMFLGILSHEKMRPVFTTVLKEYQYERLNPDTYHQKAGITAIALGGLTGKGWRSSDFSGRGWLPAASTDSVFSAFAEEFGLLGVLALLALFFGLIYFSFQVTLLAKERFGRLLAAGITAYLALHVVINIGMMSGFLPITGVPLVLITYGGSSIVSTMTALGLLQSIYIRRYMF